MSDRDDIRSAVMALQRWFQSQDLGPGEAVVVASSFIAQMISANKSDASQELKTFFLTMQGIWLEVKALKNARTK